MPSYSFTCDNCGASFELIMSFSTYNESPKCAKCRSKKTRRNYEIDMLTIASSVKKSDTELKTIGDLAKRNSERMSDDQKQDLHIKHNSYKDNKEQTKELPKGMQYTKKPQRPQWPR